MDVSVSPSAIEILRQRGGQVYVWYHDPSPEDYRMGLRPPKGPVTFVAYDTVEQLQILIDDRFMPPDALMIDVGGRRQRKLEVSWDGWRWGVGGLAQGVPAAADRGDWEAGDYREALVDAEGDSLTGDRYEFATLPDGELIVDEDCEETLTSLADAVEEELRPPYRALAVRQGARLWSIWARSIHVERLGLTDGDQLTLCSSGGQRRLEIDGIAVRNPELVAVLERFAPEGTGDYIVEGGRLDEGLWGVWLRPSFGIRADGRGILVRPDAQRASIGNQVAATPIDVSVSPAAIETIRSNGGRFYLWKAGEISIRFEVARMGLEPFDRRGIGPADRPVEFVAYDTQEGLEIFVDERLAPPDKLSIVTGGRRLRSLEAYWDDQHLREGSLMSMVKYDYDF